MKALAEIVHENKNALMDGDDLLQLLLLLQTRNIDTIVEIGTRQGFSFRAFVEALHPKIAITIDILKKEEMPAPNIIEELLECHYLWGRDSREMSTQYEVATILSPRLIDFLFIDGSHMLEDVRRDWTLYSPLVQKGGIVALHDVDEIRDDMNVKPLWDELKENFEYRLIKSNRQSTGIGVLFL